MASQNPHLFQTSDDGTEYSSTRRLAIGTTTAPIALTVADQMGFKRYYSTALTSGTNYGDYVRMDASGVGVEAIAQRAKTLLTGNSVGNAHGLHATLELDTTYGSITGLGTGLRANLVLPGRAIHGGTYYGAMAEIYCPASSDISGVTRPAILNIGANGDATAVAKVLNAIAFDGTDGTGCMIYTATNTHQTFVGSIRILVNGAAKYIHFCDAQAATS